ncbi:hypothetical protein D9757_012280 [Collybiopsis confluens]|uniref:Zinc finger PHD-type domain-containing protein n=1 Tax=Collybiopsis confluens TaxID=2823264 RepID=A0A8H5GPV3_9AGAR|nr:hypothetical protein D9757_012280 [Collybiopsis confluens]
MMQNDKNAVKKELENTSPSKDVSREMKTSTIDTKQISEIPSFPWKDQSCWIDTSLDAVLNYYGDWKDFESLVQNESGAAKPSPAYYLYLCLQSRREWSISEFSGSASKQKSLKLMKLRDNFRQLLFQFKLGVTAGPMNSHQPVMAWFSAVISPGKFYSNNNACRDYFAAQKQCVWICDSHVRLDGPRHLPACIEISSHLFQKYAGNFKEYFRSMTNIGGITKGDIQEICWRKDNAKGEVYCSGRPKLVEFFSKLPVLFTFEPNNASWDFPKILYPSTQVHGKSTGLIYDLVGRIFTNGNHFISRYVLPTAGGRHAIFTYDGMKSCGYSQLEPQGTVDKLLAGPSPPVPSGFYSHIVMYRLQGGPAAQNQYISMQTSSVLKSLNVDLTTAFPTYMNSKFRQMDPSEITLWRQARSVEYCSIIQQSKETKLQSGSFLPQNIQDVDAAIETITIGNYNQSISDLVSSSPGPSDSAHILCRCGIESDGYRAGFEQEIVECCECGRFTHLACLVNQQTEKVLGDFYCHICSLDDLANQILPRRSQRIQLKEALALQKNLFPGKCALIKLDIKDVYFYRARILAYNKVKKLSLSVCGKEL